jgi:hypothetical protein
MLHDAILRRIACAVTECGVRLDGLVRQKSGRMKISYPVALNRKRQLQI